MWVTIEVLSKSNSDFIYKIKFKIRYKNIGIALKDCDALISDTHTSSDFFKCALINNAIIDVESNCSYEMLRSGNIKWDTFNIKTKKSASIVRTENPFAKFEPDTYLYDIL